MTAKVSPVLEPLPAVPAAPKKKRFFLFKGSIAGVGLNVRITPVDTTHFGFRAKVHKGDLTGTTNPVTVALTIGSHWGTASVIAKFTKHHLRK